jgi:hypothetical protein
MVGQDLWGAQLAGVVNYVGRDAGFYQGAGVLNYARGALLGVQNAGVLSLALGGARGAQLGGVGAISGEEIVGAQIGGLFAYARDEVRGVQLSGVGNIGGEAVGLQASGVFNTSTSMEGAQLSLVNITGDLVGAQVGLVNKASKVRGAQVGLVNISDRIEGVPVGFINYERDGSQHLELSMQTDRFSGALRLGAGNLYTLLRGAVVRDSNPLEWSFGIGYGFQFPLDPFFVNLDVSVSQWLVGSAALSSWDPATLVPEVRLSAGVALRGGLGLLVGTSAEIEVPGWHMSAESKMRVTPAAFIGLQVGKPRKAAQ